MFFQNGVNPLKKCIHENGNDGPDVRLSKDQTYLIFEFINIFTIAFDGDLMEPNDPMMSSNAQYFLGIKKEGKIYPFTDKDVFGEVMAISFATIEGAKGYKKLLFTQNLDSQKIASLDVYRINSASVEKIE